MVVTNRELTQMSDKMLVGLAAKGDVYDEALTAQCSARKLDPEAARRGYVRRNDFAANAYPAIAQEVYENCMLQKEVTAEMTATATLLGALGYSLQHAMQTGKLQNCWDIPSTAHMVSVVCPTCSVRNTSPNLAFCEHCHKSLTDRGDQLIDEYQAAQVQAG